MNEQWKTIRDYKDYDVSNLGKVRSRKFGKLRTLKQFDGSAGYLQVHLYANGKCTTHNVHCLVAEAFLGPCLEGHECNHKDGVKHHNDVMNLEWVTPAENMAHASKMGLMVCGEQNGSSKLTATQVIEMRRLHAEGASLRKLGKMFGVHNSTVNKIVNFKTWRHTQ